MSMSNYARACRKLADELRQSMTPEDVQGLRGILAGVTCQGWTNWRLQYESDVLTFVSATPSQRRKRKAWAETGVRWALTMASLQHLHQAEAVLWIVAEGGLVPGASYRDTAAVAGKYYSDILATNIPEWPFDGESPFAKE